jgi:hypothetical protein
VIGMTQNRNGQVLAVIAGVFVLVFFVSYRVRTFHYCAGFADRARVVSAEEPCSAEEQPLDWNVLGYVGKLKLAGSTVAKALGAN